MSNAPMTDDPKVKELLEACRAIYPEGGFVPYSSEKELVNINRIVAAIRALDPPKPKQYTSAWEVRADALEKHIIQLQEQVMRLNDWQIKQNNAELRRQMLNQQPVTAKD